MNSWVSAPLRAPSSAEIAARRARLMGRGNVVNIAPRQPGSTEQPQRPLREPADAHVSAYREFVAKVKECPSASSYVRLRCEALGIPHDLLMSWDKSAEIVEIRQQLIREVRVGYPKLNITQIGWVFERGRSAVNHALKNKIPNWPRLPQAKVDEIRRLHATGMSQHAIRKALGVGDETVRRYVSENYNNERAKRLKRERRRKAKAA